MRQLSEAGRQIVGEVAQRHGFSPDAVMNMLDAVIHGNGSMAQFNHPEFAGSGQWMRGGMIMVSDMFNNTLKGRIDGLCSDLAQLVANQPDLIQTGSFQSQSQGGYGHGGNQQQQSGSGPIGPVSLFVPPPPGSSGNWWPGDLGQPSSTGAQNTVRYAYFAPARRLAIDVNGKVTVYDTEDHQIGGFSQQQGAGGSLTFSSQHGLVEVSALRVVAGEGQTRPAPAQPIAAAPPPAAGPESDIFATIEKLALLHGKGILSDQEFADKKADLLGRL